MEKNILVSADLGNSKIMLMAAEKDFEGKLSVIALETAETPEESIQNGVIKKPSDIASKLRELIVKLENRIENKLGKKYHIKSFYIGVNGRSLRTTRANVQRMFSTDTEISQTDLVSFRNELSNKEIEGREIYAIFEEEYLIDGDLLRKAEGRVCKDIQANYIVVYGRNDVKDNLSKCLDRVVGLDIEGKSLAPLAIADAVMTEEDRQLGCAVLNFGAATTTVAVYQDGYLRHMAVVPFGGKHITVDLKHLNVSYVNAEKIKIDYGSADYKTVSPDKQLKLTVSPGAEPRFIKLIEVNKIIEARLSEIIDLCMTEIERSKYMDRLQNGLIITGGASNLRDFVSFLTEKSNMQVRVGNNEECLNEESKSVYSKSEYSLLVGLLKNAKENCVSENANAEQPITNKKPKKKDKVKNLFNGVVDGLFRGMEDSITE